MFMGVRAFGPDFNLEEEIVVWSTPESKVFMAVLHNLKALGFTCDSIQWIGIGFLLLFSDEPTPGWKEQLPSEINGLYVGYIIGEEVREEKAKRRKVPQGADKDDSAYNDLRPGIVVSGKPDFPTPHLQNAEILSTSGVCVKSPNGSKSITVASHGFPLGVGSEVKHPNGHGRTLGTIDKVFEGTDIALCLLAPSSKYSRETFSDTNATHAHRPFSNFADVDKIQVGDRISMDSPFSGRCNGIAMKIALWTLPSDDPEARETQYLYCSYNYFGNGCETLFNGCCGAIIWDDRYNVIGQFRFQMSGKPGYCYCPSFKVLIDAGYTLSEA
ncbi:MAG: hypothetical protein Q9174_004831 [Haloplaca sp. 1 TL-2023]